MFGMDSKMRNNYHYLTEDIIVYATGDAAVLFNTIDKKRQYIFGNDGQGVGCVEVHPSKTMFAVAEKGT